MKITSRILSFLAVITILVILFNSCKKNDRVPENEQSAEKTTQKSIMYRVANIKVQAGHEDVNGNLVPFTKKNNSDLITLGDFPGCGDRTYLIDFAYNGYSTFDDHPNSTCYVYFKWTVGVPQGDIGIISSSFNKGYFRFLSGSWINTSATYVYNGTYTVVDNGSNVTMDRYLIYYTFALSESDYCFYSTFNTYVRLASDCSEVPTFQMVGSPSYIVDDFDPDTYIVYEYGAMNNGSNPSKHRFDVFPLIVSPPPCHEPTLGSSPTHEIQYRKQGTTTWTTVTSTNIATVTVDVTSTGAGVYEFQSRGLLLSSPTTYSPWSSISTVTVN